MEKEIKQRDNYTCQCCGYIGEKLDGFMFAHHLDNFRDFKEQRTEINNGVTLCKDCHHLIHKIFGKFTTKENFLDFKLLKEFNF